MRATYKHMDGAWLLVFGVWFGGCLPAAWWVIAKRSPGTIPQWAGVVLATVFWFVAIVVVTVRGRSDDNRNP